MRADHPDQRPTNAEIVARYLSGQPIRRIAADLGVSYSYVHRRLHYSGIAIRSRGGGRGARSDGRSTTDSPAGCADRGGAAGVDGSDDDYVD
ncbi:helix-turn-helix domain containing protein [Solwaraspora sp. WMMD406]|uniref:helix-turn-helix domain-containing protein n=1 Tax=Solwaraspora sp. WMMD406 TaxID=3016095 RepID=UPI002415EFA8|nr:helix-turn-helix domain-containing protein [Solwaraspora sp. WMMD406]MDG4766091.1 helix-turn-helix domain containing protein [Solwaraspora sp. WMMD406]